MAVNSNCNELAELLQAVVEPAAWGNGNESGEIIANPAKNVLQVRNRRAVQAQALMASDKLRVARGKPPVLKLDPVTFKADTRWARAKPRLETPVSLNYSQPTRLSDGARPAGRSGRSADPCRLARRCRCRLESGGRGELSRRQAAAGRGARCSLVAFGPDVARGRWTDGGGGDAGRAGGARGI